MTAGAEEIESGEEPVLDLYCSREGDGWRVYVRSRHLPRYFAVYLDRYGEAYPVQLDFEDLDRRMAKAGAKVERLDTKVGGVELSAIGDSASALAEWLSTALASGVR